MPTVGTPRSFHKKFKFIVQIDGFGSSGFQKCSELSMEIAKVEYFEGGSLIPNKSPGRVTFSDVTLDRGATKDKDMYEWARATTNVASNTGLVDDRYKRTLDIVQQDRDGRTLRRWRLLNAWPVKFNAGDWDNEADENVIESMTLTYDSFQLVQQ
jgi:phage tail-like protein